MMNMKGKFQAIMNLKFMRALRCFFNEFCDNTTIHGLRYFSARIMHWSERLWWIIAFAVSLWMCGSLIQNVWTMWNEKPVTMSFAEKEVHISTIPFPTVTICPEIKISKSKLDLSSALKSLSNLSHAQHTRLNALAHLCPQLHDRIQTKERFTDDSIYGIIRDIPAFIVPPAGMCKWQHNIDVKCDFLTNILTEEGVCFVFNALNLNDIYTNEMASGMMIVKNNSKVRNWSLGSGYKFKLGAKEYPIRTANAGPAAEFELYLATEADDLENNCEGFDQGFKVTWTVPGDEPKMSTNFFRVRWLVDTQIIIKPKLITSSEGIRSYTPKQRKCFFNSERKLRFYKMYTQNNCEAECLANFTKSECGCVKFSMPRDKNTKICGVASAKCYQLAAKNLATNTESFREKCNCLPACIFIEYEAKIDRVRLNFEESMVMSGRLAKLDIFYNNYQMETVKRIELYTLIDFWANCGSLLGLCLGISLLSIIEILFYSTLHVFWTICRKVPDEGYTVPPLGRQTSTAFLRIMRILQSFFIELCDHSNIHGLCYFTKRILHWTERLWWMIAFGLSFWLCNLMIRDIWIQWQNNPVAMSFAETDVSISAIPFPTVTICPEVKILKHKLSILERFQNAQLGDEQSKKLEMVIHICPFLSDGLIIIANKTRNRDEMSDWTEHTNNTIYDTIEGLAPRLDDVIHKCWRSELSDCSKYFAPVFTEEGICFAFNALNPHEIYTDKMALGMMITKNNPNATNWSLEGGYKAARTEGEYPIRVVDSDENAAIDVPLTIAVQDIDMLCKGFVQGFKVFLSVPGDEVKMGLRNYASNQRQCFYNSERKLRFYKIYSQSNCEMECLANFTKLECKCVKFSMPRDKKTPICGTARITCYRSAETKFSTSYKFRAKCNCMPACTSVEYNANIDHVAFDTMAINRIRGYHSNDSSIQHTTMSIHFKDTQVETAQRVEVYTFADFLAICGGLLGLFLGISALSIIELLYYTTLRLFWSIRHSRYESVAD